MNLEYSVQSQNLLQSYSTVWAWNRVESHSQGATRTSRCAPVLSVRAVVSLCDHVDCRPPGSCVHGIVPARTPDWDALLPPGDLPKQGWNSHLMWLPHCGGYFTIQPLGKPPKPKHLRSNNLTRLPRPFVGKE